jgi:hypothetical protein
MYIYTYLYLGVWLFLYVWCVYAMVWIKYEQVLDTRESEDYC